MPHHHEYQHPGFIVALIGKLGVPIVAATTVACLLGGHFEWSHGILILVGVLFEALHHWIMHHHRRRFADRE